MYGGTVQYFTGNHACSTNAPNGEDAAIYYSAGTGSHEVYGCLFAYYYQSGGGTGIYGYPTSGPYTNSQGIVEQDFQNDSLLWENGRVVVVGCGSRCN